ncbi:LysM peptidoglycan-binding domain-containing protein [Bacillus sp. FJAT-47783]|uniref:LysM peptidoglycan-binding domain-containing protein n=1 Tax=Bacillus sp. FJAT-47783 TaxID=2922712 RepID=UPI001FAD803F|nr:LysM peptidoglycan-binding domain-containing protein [Bacillus sp. FJAT-47783]
MGMIDKTRKQRLEEQKRKKNKRVVRSALALSITALALSAEGNAKACDCVSEYVVKKGDTLYSLAKTYGVTVEQLQQKNDLKGHVIKVGQILYVPFLDENGKMPYVGEKNIHVIQKGDTLWGLSKKYGVSMDSIQKANKLKKSTLIVGQTLIIPKEVKTRNVELTVDYTVEPGDTLFSLAKRFNTTVDELKKLNHLRYDIVYINQKLKIPAHATKSQQATLVGAVDNKSIEFMVNGKPLVVEVSYGASSKYRSLQGKTGELIYTQHTKDKRPSLISFKSS